MKRIGEKLVGAPARSALKSMFRDISGPLRIEQVLQRARSVNHHECAMVEFLNQLTCHLQVFARLIEIHAFHESLAFGTVGHDQVLHEIRFGSRHRKSME